MLRLVHARTVLGGLRVDDIDDGLPNKNVHRLGSTADPKAYKRDGYANAAKQPCYIPYARPGEAAVPGYINLRQTEKVTLSSGNGKIAKMQAAGLITVVTLSNTDIVAPVEGSATLNAPATGDVTILGTGFTSTTPDVSTVVFSGSGVGAKTLTVAQITGVGGGSFTATKIVIKASLIAGTIAGDKVKVRANSQFSNQITL